ncbi:hypothetical protein PMAYCL1PPCAC_00936, partial [Pristionchus mayeri]
SNFREATTSSRIRALPIPRSYSTLWRRALKNFNSPPVFLMPGHNSVISANSAYTIISGSGAVRFRNFTGFAEDDPLPSVYAAPGDAIESSLHNKHSRHSRQYRFRRQLPYRDGLLQGRAGKVGRRQIRDCLQ